jgi:hypothetical protein
VINNTATLNGLTIGDGTDYQWTAYPSGLGTPDIRSDDRVRPRRAGLVGASDLLGGRTVSFEVQVKSTSRSAIETALTVLNAAFAPSAADVWLQVRLTGTPAEYSLLGRARGVEWNLSRRFTFFIADARCTFLALDPLKYGPSLDVSIPLPTGTPGVLAPVVAPVVSAGSSGGEASLTNAGTAAVDWTATITGPMTTPRLEHVALARRVSFDLALLSGETLVLDSRTGSALLNGTTPRTSALQAGSRWWQLPVGVSTVRLRSASGTGAAVISYRNGFT